MKISYVIFVLSLILIYGCTGNNITGGVTMIDGGKKMNPIAVFDTSLGEFKIELFEDKSPITAGNFKKLAKEMFKFTPNSFRFFMDLTSAINRYPP